MWCSTCKFLLLLLLLWFVFFLLYIFFVFFDCVLRYVRRTFYYGKSTVQTVKTTAAKWQTNERNDTNSARTQTEATRMSPTNAGFILRCRCRRRRRLHNCCCARSLTPYFSHSALRVTSRGARAPQVCPYHGERKHRVTLIRVEGVPCIFLFSDLI